MTVPRRVCPEVLDDLAPDDPRAVRSRRDLQRVHRAMLSVSALKRALTKLRLRAPPRTVLELGAGDGTLLLRLAASIRPRWTGVKLTLLDRQRIVKPETVEEYRGYGWEVTTVCEDVLTWARQSNHQHYDLGIATLFLHHFQDPELRALLRGVASQCRAFIAIEPRRDSLAKFGSRLIGVLGTNAVTREDAVTSVDAGFIGSEISAAWPSTSETWRTEEFRVLPFSHAFVAAQNVAAPAHA